MSRPIKLEKSEVLRRVKSALASGKIYLSSHAEDRMRERNISWYEVKEVLANGFNESAKDQYKTSTACWNYAIRHDIRVSDIDKRRLRIPIAFDEDDTVVVTAIDIDLD